MKTTELVDRLIDAQVPLHRWGHDANAKLDGLARKIESGAAKLKRDKFGLYCKFRSADVAVFFQDLVLLNTRIILNGATVRNLPDTNGATISVPVRKGEEAEIVGASALRAFFSYPENEGFDNVSWRRLHVGPFASPAYPGLRIQYDRHRFDCRIPTKLYQGEGYVKRSTAHAGGILCYEWLKLEL